MPLLFHFLCHTQAMERYVKVMSKASLEVCSAVARHSFIGLRFLRRLMPKFENPVINRNNAVNKIFRWVVQMDRGGRLYPATFKWCVLDSFWGKLAKSCIFIFNLLKVLCIEGRRENEDKFQKCYTIPQTAFHP